MEDFDIIQECLAGRKQAFGYLVRRYQAEAIGHAVALLGNRPDALDVVQDAFIAAFQALDRFDPSRRFYPWFYTILRNRCYKLLLQRKKRSDRCLAEVSWLDLSGDVKSSEQTTMVQEVLQGLNAEDRELLTLKHIDGLKYHDIAEHLGIPDGTVMSRLYHARRRFRRLYQKQVDLNSR
ncbi:RNA polymerase sigma factor [Planctomycetota bacterium]